MSDGAKRIARERERQINAEGWTPEHDDEHDGDELAWAAVCYAAPGPVQSEREIRATCGCREAMCPHEPMFGPGFVDPWPWDESWDKRGQHDRIRQLEIAGALIAAEIDRLLRARKGAESE